MDRKRLTEHLALAERHVRESKEHVARQTDLIARLEEHGLDTAEARRLLREFQQLLAFDLATRDRAREELALELQD